MSAIFVFSGCLSVYCLRPPEYTH